MNWDPERYQRYERERNRPVEDLIRGLGGGRFRRIVDLGCGPGNSTEALRRHFPNGLITALDSDPAMVEAARLRLQGLAVEEADIARWTPPEGVDLLFSNAVFHWLPDHLPLLARLFAALAPRGVLAVQMPDNLDEPSHRLMGETSMAGPWALAFAEGLPVRPPLPLPRDYMAALAPGGAEVSLWRTTYFHRFANAGAIVDFLRGAGLRPFAERIRARAGEAAHDAWLERYEAEIARAYPPLDDGSVLMPMPRLFIVARR